ncbi:hypothetical protein SAMN05421505_10194 [Sinosporangium album]|uniref:Uncharacterized protein n=1 Tax=Sinosporangium album TaxID=504805 RepID=A0A1G7QTY0_9ACTN|nr:hypothetical protein [Sinosporangium album]SDG01120.1 hypothetical protein SAMN05421505_10194 [Sinosporangium album]
MIVVPEIRPNSRTSTTQQKADVTAQVLRTDRILYEVEQTGGDVRRICDLFSVSIETALRYAGTILGPPVPAESTPTR